MIFMTRRTLVRTAALETGMMLAAPLLAAETKPLTGAELQNGAVSISKVRRSPGWPNLPLADSERAIDFMVARYGEQIRYEPDMTAGSAARWAAPWEALGAWGLFLAARMRRKGAKADRA